jgi:hypothetical protein
LIFDSDKTDGDIGGSDSHDLADFFVTEILQPEEDDGPVERPQSGDPSAEQFCLPGTFIRVFEQVDVERQGFGAGPAPLRTVMGDTGVKAYLPDPGSQSGLSTEGSGALPQVDEDFLEEVCHLVLVG